MLARALAVLAVAAASSLAAAAPFPEPVDLGQGVYVFLGAREEASRENAGHVANQGFIVAAAGVIVIDTGLSAAFAEPMLRAIRARTGKPLALVILTWPMDEAIFGASVFQQNGVPVLAHEVAALVITWLVRQLSGGRFIPRRRVGSPEAGDGQRSDGTRRSIRNEMKVWNHVAPCFPGGNPIEILVVALDPVHRR